MAVSKQADKWLRDGIKAVQRGQRARGRALLLQVLEQAGELEAAWWWLSQATDDPAERLRALQKVMALNPAHAEAQARLVELRLQGLPAGPVGPPAAAPPDFWSGALPEVTLEADDGVDNPYQCPYCGQLTGEADRRCPHCRGSLYRRVTFSGSSEALRRLQLVLGIGLALGVLELAAPLLALGYRQGSGPPVSYAFLLAFPGVQPLLGSFIDLTVATSELLLKVLAVRAAVFVVLILGLRARLRLAYYGAMLVLLADLLLMTYLLMAGYLGWAGLLLNIAFTLGGGLLLFAVSFEFAVNHERRLVRPDPAAHGALDFYRRGHAYQRRGMWALAVAQWRKAVGLAPRTPEYYKDLGLGYAHIGRYDRSLRALHEGQRQAPDSTEFDKIIALVEAEARQRRAGP